MLTFQYYELFVNVLGRYEIGHVSGMLVFSYTFICFSVPSKILLIIIQW